MSAAKLEALVWVLVYGGLLALGLGLAVRGDDAALGGWLLGGGAVAAAVGVVLIWVRARMRDPAIPEERP